MIDASCLLPRLCVGSYPRPGFAVADAFFDVLLLCADEKQEGEYPGVAVWHCPMEDGPVTLDMSRDLPQLAEDVARAWRDGQAILITCAAGLNRSALVAALAYRLITGLSGKQARLRTQEVRPGALFNAAFARYLDDLPPPMRLDRSSR